MSPTPAGCDRKLSGAKNNIRLSIKIIKINNYTVIASGICLCGYHWDRLIKEVSLFQR